MSNKHRHITEDEMQSLVSSAVANYELSCEWRRVMAAVQEDIHELLGERPRQSAVRLVVRRAQAAWQGHVIAVNRANGE